MSDEHMEDTPAPVTGEPMRAGAGSPPASNAVPPAPPVPPAPVPGGSGAPPWTPPVWTPPAPEHPERGWRTGGIAFGVLLVLIGLFALFGGLTSVFDVLRLWPLLIVFGGIMEIVRPRREAMIKRIAEGLGTVAFGLVLLGNTFGYIPWTAWFAVASLWPVLLVAIGIELVGKGLHADWLRACSNVLLILALGYGVFVLQPTSGHVSFPFVTTSAATETFSDAKAHDPAVQTGSAVVKAGATRLTVGGGDALAAISGRSPAAQKPTLTATLSGSAADVSVSEPGDRTVFIGTEDSSLDVKLDRAVKWSEVRLDVGAIAGDIDLSTLAVSRVLLNVGASDVKVKIGTMAKDVTVDVSGGATSVTVLVPASAACTVNSASGLSNVQVPSTFRQTSGIVVIGNSTFVSDGSGGPAIDISLRSGVSDLRVETY